MPPVKVYAKTLEAAGPPPGPALADPAERLRCSAEADWLRCRTRNAAIGHLALPLSVSLRSYAKLEQRCEPLRRFLFLGDEAYYQEPLVRKVVKVAGMNVYTALI